MTERPARVALVTGGGRGIGRHLALGLGRAGLSIGLLGRSAAVLEEVAAELREAGGAAAVAVAGVRRYAEVEQAAAALEGALGGIDLLVNNAGVVEPVEVPVWEADPGQWWQVVETDLRGPFHCVRAVVPARPTGRSTRRTARRRPGCSGSGATCTWPASRGACARSRSLPASSART